MKITKRQLIAALNVAYEAGFDSRNENWSEGCSFADIACEPDLDDGRDKAVKRIAKHEAKHAKMRKLKNVRKHWNVAKDYAINLELGVGKSATLPDLIAEFDLEFDLTSTTSDNNESNAIKLNETSTEEDV